MADCVVVGSSFSKASLIEVGVPEPRIRIIPFGCDVSRFSPAVRARADGRFRILFVGGVGQRKGIKYLLEAYRELDQPECELVVVGAVVGSGKGLEQYKGLYTCVPRVSDRELPDLFRGADVLVLPSVVEGFGIVILEAMASGLPVITTPNTGGPDVIREGVDGFIVPIRDSSALRDKLRLLHGDRELRHSMGVSARERAREFTWAEYWKRMGEVLKSVLDERPEPRSPASCSGNQSQERQLGVYAPW